MHRVGGRVALLLVAIVAVGGEGGAARALPARPETHPRPTAAVRTETQLRDAWSDPLRTRIDLAADIALRDCHAGDPIRESPYPMLLDGHGHTIRQTCFEKRVLRQDGTGWLDIRSVTLTRGGSDGPGAALTSRGEVMLRDCVVKQNLAEEPGGGVFSMRRVTAHHCRISGNLANDDGGGIYARRGGVQVYDSVLSTNLVDGSGGAVGSTGDILVVDSWVDGNTTDGDGGALYADEDGDVTVIRSLIDGSDADGPGGAIFTLDGDVAVLDSTLTGNRADDRGGAIAGEADVLAVNSTIARNLAVAHAGGGIWARGDLTLVNTTVTNNYAEGDGGGVLAAGSTALVLSTITRNIASVGGDIGAAGPFSSFGSIIGPPAWEGVTGDTIPTHRSCRVYAATSLGYNFVVDQSCDLDHATDIVDSDPRLAQLEDDPKGFVLEPLAGSPVLGRIPSGSCRTDLPHPLPAGQLLVGWLDWGVVLAHDAVDRPRDVGAACDIGAVQSRPSPPSARSIAPRVPGLGPDAPPADTVVAPAPAGRAEPPRSGLRALALRIAVLDRAARRGDVLLGCTSRVGVDRVGDRRHRWGFRYDERDGTGLDRRPALALHRGDGPARWDLLRLSPAHRCLSAPADPNGAGDDARLALGRRAHESAWARVRRLQRAVAVVDRRVTRFDAWESCLSWLPVTEGGQTQRAAGYLVTARGGSAYRPALDLDHSEWDDPDYQVLALPGRARPLAERGCGDDPGESVDRRARTSGERSDPDLRDAVRELREDVEDLAEPVDEITRFDQCLFTVGVASHGGYRYDPRRGPERRRAALSFDLRGRRLPQLSVLAFPGEEPPQIECNEDAGGVETHE